MNVDLRNDGGNSLISQLQCAKLEQFEVLIVSK